MSPEPEVRRRRAPRGSGDRLRDEILDAATELLLATGHARAVSIRAVARRVGVTPPSLYLHFADKDALLDAVCARYFEKLDAHMQEAGAGHENPIDVLRAQGMAYVRFALRTPELYRIATMWEGSADSDVDQTLASSAFLHMRAAVQQLMDDGIYAQGDPTAVTLELWTAAHGAAALLIAKPYLPWGDAEAFTDRVLRAACGGQVIAGLIGPDATSQESIQLMKSLSAQHDSPR